MAVTGRWLKFNLVGAAGIVVQLGALSALTRAFHWDYLIATAAAVETAVLHNFCWHMAWTWRDRRDAWPPRLLRFHLGNGAVSLASNLALMRFCSGVLHMPILAASLVSITLTALLNYLVSEYWVFTSPPAASRSRQ
jgi:putative flippase GtrA